MPRNRQCGHVCPHSNFLGWLAGALAGGIVIIISAVIYLWWKFCRKVTIDDRLDGSNPFLLSNEEKGRNCPSTFERGLYKSMMNPVILPL